MQVAWAGLAPVNRLAMRHAPARNERTTIFLLMAPLPWVLSWASHAAGGRRPAACTKQNPPWLRSGCGRCATPIPRGDVARAHPAVEVAVTADKPGGGQGLSAPALGGHLVGAMPRWRRRWTWSLITRCGRVGGAAESCLAELPAAGRPDYARGVRFGVLGPLDVRSGGELLTIKGVKERRLLGLLLSRANSVVPVGDIIEALWGADPPRSAAKSVQVYVVRVRKMLTARHRTPRRHPRPHARHPHRRRRRLATRLRRRLDDLRRRHQPPHMKTVVVIPAFIRRFKPARTAGNRVQPSAARARHRATIAAVKAGSNRENRPAREQAETLPAPGPAPGIPREPLNRNPNYAVRDGPGAPATRAVTASSA